MTDYCKADGSTDLTEHGRLSSLTPDQEARLPAIRDKWIAIGLSTAPADRVRAEAGISDAEIAQENRIGSAFVGWIAGCALIWSSLFAIGNFLYAAGDPKRLTMAWILTGATLVSGYVLLRITRQLWADSTASQAREDAKNA